MTALYYEIRPGKHTPCELVSVVATNFGGDAVNLIAQGTHTHCQRVLDAIKKDSKQDVPTMNYHEPHTEKAGPLEKALIWGGAVLFGLAFWYGLYRLALWALFLPIVYESYTTGNCVRIDDVRGVYSCENMPRKYHHQWVE